MRNLLLLSFKYTVLFNDDDDNDEDANDEDDDDEDNNDVDGSVTMSTYSWFVVEMFFFFFIVAVAVVTRWTYANWSM